MIPITIAAFVIFLVLGVPVAFAVGMAGFLGLWWSGEYPLAIIIQQIFLTADSFVLLAIPLFVLAGALMEPGGIAVRLVRFAQALVGWVRGGLAMAVVVAEYIFSGISGSTIADVSSGLPRPFPTRQVGETGSPWINYDLNQLPGNLFVRVPWLWLKDRFQQSRSNAHASKFLSPIRKQ